jgi:predicted DCC family thiol-disulfide oxidoreductase YuxK
MTHTVLLFDGECNLCNSTVNFILEKDKKGKIKFASLQSETGKQLSRESSVTTSNLSSVVLIHNKQVFTKSDVVLQVSIILGGVWKLLALTRVIPRPIRNWIYDLIAKNRYKWFGKTNQCKLPSTNISSRFIS